MIRNGAPTRAERVHAELRADILAGRQRPAARLPFTDLAARFGVSMGVVREALIRLTAEGLVESQPQYGFRVAAISMQDLRNLTEARRHIETLVLRQAFAHGGVDWESDVLAAHHRLQRTAPMTADDPGRICDEWAAAHSTYHLALLSGCPNPRLLAAATSLRDSAELYRRWSVPLGHEQRDVPRERSAMLGPEQRDVPGEHGAILDAVVAHDADLAVALLIGHIEHTTDALLDQLHEPGDPTAP